MKYRYFIRLSYRGDHYHGWQEQKNASSIQSTLADALSVILKISISLVGAGRTDSGVHAREFYAHFDLPQILADEQKKQLIYNLNGYLENDISIHDILPVTPGAHARFSAISRTYKYFITKRKDPFQLGFSYYYPGFLDIEKMNQGAALLKLCTDFTSFAKVSADTKTNICHVSEAAWEMKEDILVFTITADRFLRNMVRAVVGTLIELGRGKIRMEDLNRIIMLKDRSAAGYSVPACGLFLESIKYPEDIFL